MKMLLLKTALILAMLSATGCMTQKTETALDLTEPFDIKLLHQGQEVGFRILEEEEIGRILRYALQHMRTASTTYPTPTYKLIVSGKSVDGENVKDYIFIGQNWIGDGVGISTLADTQAFRLNRLIQDSIANQSEQATATAAPPLDVR